MTVTITAVVFDLADVLLEFDGVASVSRLSLGRVGAPEFGRFWESPTADRLYRGLCTPDEFAVAAVAALALPIAPEAFLEDFRTWLRGPYPGAFELVGEGTRARHGDRGGWLRSLPLWYESFAAHLRR